MIPSPIDTEPKNLIIAPGEEIAKQAEKMRPSGKKATENEKTIYLLREEIQILKSELKQKTSQNFCPI